MNIIVAEEADIEELVQVEIESKKQLIPSLIEDYEVDPSLRFQRWKTYFHGESPLTSKPERIVFKAKDNSGTIIGYISGHLTTRFNIDAEIQSFYVLKNEQRKGVGTALFKMFAI